MAYRLDLPPHSRIHPVFHAAQLKEAGGIQGAELKLPSDSEAELPLQCFIESSWQLEVSYEVTSLRINGSFVGLQRPRRKSHGRTLQFWKINFHSWFIALRTRLLVRREILLQNRFNGLLFGGFISVEPDLVQGCRPVQGVRGFRGEKEGRVGGAIVFRLSCGLCLFSPKIRLR